MNSRYPVVVAADRTELDRSFSPSTCVPDIDVFLREYANRSAVARAAGYQELRYGPRPPALLDYFPADRPGAPLLVYVHGGYWQELDKADSSFAAPGLLDQGVAFAALGYGLAPDYSLDEIVAMVRAGLWWLVSHLRPGAVYLAGSSAGAHLVAMALLDGWLPGGRHPADVFASATLLSGVYDLRRLRLTYVNDKLGLDAAAAVRHSPLDQLPDRLPPLVVARGEHETDEFAAQQTRLVAEARRRDADVTELVVPGRNHFDLPLDLGTPGTALGDAVLGILGR
jgi:arylformamidase